MTAPTTPGGREWTRRGEDVAPDRQAIPFFARDTRTATSYLRTQAPYLAACTTVLAVFALADVVLAATR